MSEKNSQNSEFEGLHTDDGYTVINQELTGRRSAENTFEGFLANSLHMIGIKEIFSFKTRRDLGTGELVSPEGQSQGRVTIWGKGFQRK